MEDNRPRRMGTVGEPESDSALLGFVAKNPRSVGPIRDVVRCAVVSRVLLPQTPCLTMPHHNICPDATIVGGNTSTSHNFELFRCFGEASNYSEIHAHVSPIRPYETVLKVISRGQGTLTPEKGWS